jgi:hypothetical protein
MARTLRLGASAAVALVLLSTGSIAGTGNGLYGVVRKGPVTPVCRVGVPCNAPVRLTLVFSRAGRTVGSVRSALTGRYRIALAPGFYDVRSAERVGIGRLPTPHAVHVRAGRWDRIDLLFDTGIR